MPSVTTVLNILSKGPFFEKWLASKTAEESKQLTDTAADLGTRVHALIEDFINIKLGTSLGETIKAKEDEILTYKAFLQWHGKYQPGYLKSELFLYSKKHKYAGTTDFIAMIDGEVCLVDIKTSARCYDTMGLQLSAYAHAYTEMTGVKVDKLFILRLDKITGKYQWKEYKNEFKVFESVLKVFNWRNNGTRKPVKPGSGKLANAEGKRVTGSRNLVKHG